MNRKLHFLMPAFAVIGVLSTLQMFSGLAFAGGLQKATPKPAAKITPDAAMAAAAAKSNGKAAMAIFEFDEGHWVYGVIVVKKHKLMEIDVDPTTGKVGDTESVTPEGEGKEFRSELAKLAKS